MSLALKTSYAQLLEYLENPHKSVIDRIIEHLKDSEGDYASFITQYKLLLTEPENELDIVSRLDILYEEAFAQPKPAANQRLGEDAIELLDDFIEEANEQLIIFVESLIACESNPHQAGEFITRAFRAMHTIKGSAGFLSLGDIVSVTHEMETVLGKARETATLKEETISPCLKIESIF